MQGKIKSWAIRAGYARFKNHMLGINPLRSYTRNIGMGSGTHTTTKSTYRDGDISLAPAAVGFPEVINVDERIRKVYHDCYDGEKRPLPQRMLRRLGRLLRQYTLVA